MKYIMTKDELKKAQVIGQAIDGLITVNKAAELLHLSPRRVKQLKAGYRKSGAESCIHASRGKVSDKKTPHQLLHKL